MSLEDQVAELVREVRGLREVIERLTKAAPTAAVAVLRRRKDKDGKNESDEKFAARCARAAGASLQSVKATATRLGVADSTIRSMIKSGELQAVKVSSAWRISADAVIGKPIPVKTKVRKESAADFAMRILEGGRR